MTLTSPTISMDDFIPLAERFKILGEPARLAILAALCGSERNVGEICDRTGLQAPNVSKHLRLMRDANVVACRRVGSCRYYRVLDPDLLQLCAKFRDRIAGRTAPPAIDGAAESNYFEAAVDRPGLAGAERSRP